MLAVTPSAAKRGTSARRSSCACSIDPDARVASNTSSATAFARSPIAWTADASPPAWARPTSAASSDAVKLGAPAGRSSVGEASV